jgi:5-methylcytosine-specific restriction endonuclease McrA
MSKAFISRALRDEAESHFQGRCAYCQSPKALMNVTFEVDHIVPEKEGVLTEKNNLALSCPLCNGFKGVRTRGSDPLTGGMIPLFHPRRQSWSRHFRWASVCRLSKGAPRAGVPLLKHYNSITSTSSASALSG